MRTRSDGVRRINWQSCRIGFEKSLCRSQFAKAPSSNDAKAFWCFWSVPLELFTVDLFGAGLVLTVLDLFRHAGIVFVLVDRA